MSGVASQTGCQGGFVGASWLHKMRQIWPVGSAASSLVVNKPEMCAWYAVFVCAEGGLDEGALCAVALACDTAIPVL